MHGPPSEFPDRIWFVILAAWTKVVEEFRHTFGCQVAELQLVRDL